MTPRAQISLVAGLAVVVMAFVVWSAPLVLSGVQGRVMDLLVQTKPASAPSVIVVDIGDTADTGAGWDRAATARLVAAIAKARPAVIAFDVVYSGNCAPAPVNADLARAFGAAPVVLGFLLSDGAGPAPARSPQLMVANTPLWAAPGAEFPCAGFDQPVGAVSFLGGQDGRIRRVPAGVAVAGVAYPSLAVEAIRLAHGHPAPLLARAGDRALLRLGETVVTTDAEGQLWLAPSPPEIWAARTLDAVAVLNGAGAERLADAIVFVGSSLPQRGGLRATATSPLHPSVQIHADEATSLLSGFVPYRARHAAMTEAAFVLFGGFLGLLAVLRLPVFAGLAAGAGLALIWPVVCLVTFRSTAAVMDPVFPPAAVLLACVLALAGKAWASGRAERALRQKMAQLLPQPVISRLIAEPHLLRLKGERRVITALFTDIEGFSRTTHALGPEALVDLLDAYFTLTSAAVLRHGGMIDKIVGDSVHALFNAPLDQQDHVDAAIRCAAEIVALTDAFRQSAAMVSAGLGRTRIGVETGPAVLGDVGSGARIDYTAHGDAINLAARLQEANKELGSAICIGPAAAAVATLPLRALGVLEIRSFGALQLYSVEMPTLAKAASIRA